MLQKKVGSHGKNVVIETIVLKNHLKFNRNILKFASELFKMNVSIRFLLSSLFKGFGYIPHS